MHTLVDEMNKFRDTPLVFDGELCVKASRLNIAVFGRGEERTNRVNTLFYSAYIMPKLDKMVNFWRKTPYADIMLNPALTKVGWAFTHDNEVGIWSCCAIFSGE